VSIDLDAARGFQSKNARLLERHRFTYLLDRGSWEPVLSALNPYQNPDGGYGHGLEPDLRGPLSQPVPVWTALWILDELKQLDQRSAGRILAFLLEIERPGGGVPFVLGSASQYPHAPWWEVRPGPLRASLNPTAGIAAAFFKNGIESPWLDRAAAWCWGRIEKLRETNPYEIRTVLSFLDHAPDRQRAQANFERLRPKILRPGVVELDVRARGDGFRPLDLAPEPGLLSRELFTDEVVEQHLQALELRQRRDGGWTVNFPIWTPITKFEWRGVQTVESLKTLLLNGRLGS
jgi:hypothetical protein